MAANLTIAYLPHPIDESIRTCLLKFAAAKNLGRVHFITNDRNTRILKVILDSLTYGDSLIVNSLGELGSDLSQRLALLCILGNKKIRFFAVEGDISFDDKVSGTKAFAIAAKLARLQYKLPPASPKVGRPTGTYKSRLDQFAPEIKELLQKRTSKTSIAKKFNTSLPNLYNWIKRNPNNIR